MQIFQLLELEYYLLTSTTFLQKKVILQDSHLQLSLILPGGLCGLMVIGPPKMEEIMEITNSYRILHLHIAVVH